MRRLVRVAVAIKRFAQLRTWPDAAVEVVCFGFEEKPATPPLISATEYLRPHADEPEAENLRGVPKPGLLAHAQEWGADMVVMEGTRRMERIQKALGHKDRRSTEKGAKLAEVTPVDDVSRGRKR